ncbi:uncharacterized protein BT62DRAFT_928749 [Guyanagaster necrorhizus]|uniref:Uncharacterized protein n=1 Tax=Guyanagaster necrorhizus TaxID=856835 RepID=A0A9P7VZS2_9AGAR|nr:uncharacterized protein BT62DRAFT_928749 [Guyanagaster necrorhizus MCA 3950]KAG7449972.1 hypothetical protein BT62DRAFT_928749 [Guyanagaster necrorhizus MCA 3950]
MVPSALSTFSLGNLCVLACIVSNLDMSPFYNESFYYGRVIWEVMKLCMGADVQVYTSWKARFMWTNPLQWPSKEVNPGMNTLIQEYGAPAIKRKYDVAWGMFTKRVQEFRQPPVSRPFIEAKIAEARQRKAEAEQKEAEAQQHAAGAHRMAAEARQRTAEARQRTEEACQRTAEAHLKRAELQKRTVESRQKATEARQRLAGMQQRIAESQQRIAVMQYRTAEMRQQTMQLNNEAAEVQNKTRGTTAGCAPQ